MMTAAPLSQRLDRHTRLDAQGNVDHAKSARSNWDEVTEKPDVLSSAGVLTGAFVVEMFKRVPQDPGFALLLPFVAPPVALLSGSLLVFEATHAVASKVKNAVDAAVHGAIALTR